MGIGIDYSHEEKPKTDSPTTPSGKLVRTYPKNSYWTVQVSWRASPSFPSVEVVDSIATFGLEERNAYNLSA